MNHVKLTGVMTNTNVLVVGGTGRTAGRIVRRPEDRGLQTHIDSKRGKEPFLWKDHLIWDAALREALAAYICYPPDPTFRSVAELIGKFAERAQGVGVNCMELLSGRGEAGARAGERAIHEKAAEWTALRSSWFAQNFSGHFLLGPTLRGRLILPAGDLLAPFIDIEDLAQIASSALIGDGHAVTTYGVAGPRLLSMRDVAANTSCATGRHVEYAHRTAAGGICKTLTESRA